MSRFMLSKTYLRIFIIFLLAIIFLYTIFSTSILFFSATDLGLLNRVPLIFWIGLSLLACFWYLSKDSEKYLFVAFGFTLLYLYLVPTIVRVPVWISESYFPFGESQLINSYGHLVTADFANDVLGVERSLPLMSYQNWPLFLYLSSSFTLLTGMPASLVQKFFPFLTISIYGLLAFMIFKSKLEPKYALVGATLFLTFFFTRQNYFGPQGIAYILFLMTIFVLIQISFMNREPKKIWIGLFVGLFVALTLTHALTSLIMLFVIFALFLAKKLKHNFSAKLTSRLGIFAVVFLFSYNWFFAQDFIFRAIQTLSQFFLEFGKSSLFKETSRIVGSEAQQLNYVTSWSIVIIAALIAGIQILSVLNTIRLQKNRENNQFSLFTIFWLIFLFVFALTAVYGSHEAYQRAFMFGLIPLSYLCVKLLSKKPILLFIVVGGMLFLNFSAQYGADSYRTASEPILEGTQFFVEHSPNNVSVLYNFYPHIRYFDPLKTVRFVSISGTLPFTTYPNSSVVNRAIMRADYICYSSLQHNYYVYFLGDDPFEQASFNGLNRIYDNGDYQLFNHAN